MKKTIVILSCVFSLSTFSSANADNLDNAYLGLGGSATFLEDSNIKVSGLGSVGEYSYKTGYGADTSVGYDFGGVRVEAEYAYRTNNTNNFNGVNATGSRIDSHAVMANAYIDIPTGGIVKPYIGAGAGYALVRPEGDGTEGKVAYQGMAGVNFEISDKTTFYTGYKYFATAGRAEFDTGAGGKYSVDYHSSNVEAGFRFKF